MNNKLIIISGATATGKTDLSVLLAKLSLENSRLTPVIMNFDSLCFYTELSIGTAKPTKDEQSGIEHELFNISSISNELDASQYVRLAENKINELMKENKLIFLVGGSAFYLRALIKGMYDSQKIPAELKIITMDEYNKSGIGFILTYLQKFDPQSLKKLHPNDHYRIIRAYYHHKLTGKNISDEKNKMDLKNPYDLSAQTKNNWLIHHIYLKIPKEEHHSIILKRTKRMIKTGLIEEVQSLSAKGFSGNEKPLKSVGYKEVYDFLSKEENSSINTEDELIERIFISTRQLAKSQKTFFKKIFPKLEYNPLTDSLKIQQDFFNFIKR